MKTVFAVEPYTEPGRPIFKVYAYDAWKNLGGQVRPSHHPIRIVHHFAFKYQLPRLYHNKKEARLRFVQPSSINFDTFPDHAIYEIIPFIWDCWPKDFERTCQWFVKNDVKTAIFTSSQTAALMQDRFPKINVLAVTEGIDTQVYKEGSKLNNRSTDILIYGRPLEHIVSLPSSSNYNVYRLGGLKGKKLLHTQDDLINKLSDSKIVLAFPQSISAPEHAGNIETLTQRYWEGMLSRCILIGHAPQELIKLLGYNPVIEVPKEQTEEGVIYDTTKMVSDILANIENFQSLVDINRNVALTFGKWEYSIMKVMKWLKSKGYKV